MRKVLVNQFGDESALELISVEAPNPGRGQVRVRVLRSGVSGADVNMRRGLYPFQPKPPLTPGYTVVGRVEANGSPAPRFSVGTLVACLSVTGAYAEQVLLPEKFLVPVPEAANTEEGLDQIEALILDAMTAFQMLTRATHLRVGQSIFVHGLSGAVGSSLAQFGKQIGLVVYGTASPDKHEAVKKLGAQPFDYRNHAWVEKMVSQGGVDAVFDPLGFESFVRSEKILKRGGVLVGYGFNSQGFNGAARGVILPFLAHFLRNLKFWTGKKAAFYGISRTSASYAEDLTELMSRVVAKKLQPLVKASFPFERIQDAHRAWSKHPGIGSIVIRMK